MGLASGHMHAKDNEPPASKVRGDHCYQDKQDRPASEVREGRIQKVEDGLGSEGHDLEEAT